MSKKNTATPLDEKTTKDILGLKQSLDILTQLGIDSVSVNAEKLAEQIETALQNWRKLNAAKKR